MDISAIEWNKAIHVVAPTVPCEIPDQLVDLKLLFSKLQWAQFEGYSTEQIWAGMEREMKFLHEFQ
eukprot:552560-Heterocapsa_arctica.AAC.1